MNVKEDRLLMLIVTRCSRGRAAYFPSWPSPTGSEQFEWRHDQSLNISQTNLEYLSRWKTVLGSMALPVIVTVEWHPLAPHCRMCLRKIPDTRLLMMWPDLLLLVISPLWQWPQHTALYRFCCETEAEVDFGWGFLQQLHSPITHVLVSRLALSVPVPCF